MDLAKIILEYLRVLVWPITVVALSLLFRVQVKKLLARLKKADLPGGVSIDFDEEIREVRRLSEKIELEPPPSDRKKIAGIPLTEANARMIKLKLQPTLSGLDMSYYRALAETDPVLSLAGVRIELETLARNLAQGFGLELKGKEPVTRILASLRDKGAITPDQAKLAHRILKVCNEAVHGKPVSRAQAEEVIDAVSVLAKDYLAWLSWGFPDNWKPIEPEG